jgi:serum/glucocorticoid-regulated kinase 2
MNKSKIDRMTVLFVDDPYKLRIKLEDYHKSVILARGSISKIYLLHNKSNNT